MRILQAFILLGLTWQAHGANKEETLRRIFRSVETGHVINIAETMEELDEPARKDVVEQLKSELVEMHDDLTRLQGEINEQTVTKRLAFERVRNLSAAVGVTSAVASLFASQVGFRRFLRALAVSEDYPRLGRFSYMQNFYADLFANSKASDLMVGSPRLMHMRGLYITRATTAVGLLGLLGAAVSHAYLSLQPEMKKVRQQMNQEEDLHLRIVRLQKTIEAVVLQLEP